jgi:hypothetical protein
LFFSINVVIPHSPPHPLSVCLHAHACMRMPACSLPLSRGDLAALCHIVSVCSHRFFQPNQSPELKTGYQKQLIGTVSGSPALNLSLDNLF